MSVAAVLCPGASLSRLTARPDADLVFAVNDAAKLGWHDYVVTSKICNRGNAFVTASYSLTQSPLAHGVRAMITDKGVRELAAWGGDFHPAYAAMLIASLFADSVIVYGDDRCGGTRFDGSERSTVGFKVETAVYERVAEYLGDRLTRVAP